MLNYDEHYGKRYYEGQELYARYWLKNQKLISKENVKSLYQFRHADFVLCPSDEVYDQKKVANILIPNRQPMIYTCPTNTSASIIQLTRGPEYT